MRALNKQRHKSHSKRTRPHSSSMTLFPSPSVPLPLPPLFFLPRLVPLPPPFSAKGSSSRREADCQFVLRRGRAGLASPPPQNQLERSRALVARAHAPLARRVGTSPSKTKHQLVSFHSVMLLFVRKTRLTKKNKPSRKKQKMYVVENEMSVAMCPLSPFAVWVRLPGFFFCK